MRICPYLYQVLTDQQQFMMNFEFRLEKPNISRAWISAGTMGLAYFIGQTPSPYIFFISSH
jgi:hypothetical protein